MDAISKINLTGIESAQPSNASLSLTRASGISPEIGMVCLLLMKQTKDRYIKQQLPEQTAEMYLAEWEEMVCRYSLVEFRDALSRTIRNRNRAQFFPEPHEIEAECIAARRTRRERDAGAQAVQQVDSLRAQWERERQEDIANGIKRGSEPVAEMSRMLSSTRTPEEIQAHIAATTTPEQLQAVRDRMEALRAAEEMARAARAQSTSTLMDAVEVANGTI